MPTASVGNRDLWKPPLWLAWLILGVGTIGFAAGLGRYPRTCVDEVFYNYPAVHYLHTGRLTAPVSTGAPWPDLAWGYHAPFFPRLQVLTFRALGISAFACRAPQYISAVVAILLITRFLHARGLALSALLVATAWVGDRAHHDVLFGRMDGCALLLLVCGFIALAKLFEARRGEWAFACGIFIGGACGFHPIVGLFVLTTLLIIVCGLRGKQRLGAAAAFCAGCAVPALVWVLCWLPHFTASCEQFSFNMHMTLKRPFGVALRDFWGALQYSRGFTVAIVVGVFGWAIPVILRRFLKLGSAGFHDPRQRVLVLCSVFATTGLLCFLRSPLYTFYLIYFALFAIAAISVTLELNPPRAPYATAIIVLFAALWLPGFLWNVNCLRYALMYWRANDDRLVASILMKNIPPGADVWGEPVLFLFADKAHLQFTPLPWYPEKAKAPAASWLVLSAGEFASPIFSSAPDIASRKIQWRGDALPNAKPFGLGLVILRPVVVDGQK